MNTFVDASPRASAKLLGEAVHRSSAFSLAGLHERAFTFAFRGLVYPQIWEDPRVDLEALELDAAVAHRHHRLGRLQRDELPRRRSGAHHRRRPQRHPYRPQQAQARGAAGTCPTTRRSCASSAPPTRPPMSRPTTSTCAAISTTPRCAYWEGTDLVGRRRITRFARGFHRFGLLGRFIGAGHLLARLYGKDPRRMLAARSLEEQREIFRTELAPLFDKRFVRRLLGHRMSLYGLGIPPAQYVSLSDGAATAADVVRAAPREARLRLRPRRQLFRLAGLQPRAMRRPATARCPRTCRPTPSRPSAIAPSGCASSSPR